MAVWLAIVGKRTLHGTIAFTRAPEREARSAREECLVVVEAVHLDDLRLDRGVVVELEHATVGYLSSTLRIERGLAQLGEKEVVAELLDRAELREDTRLCVAHERSREARRAGEVRCPLEAAVPAGP